jgi:hypothetical protein
VTQLKSGGSVLQVFSAPPTSGAVAGLPPTTPGLDKVTVPPFVAVTGPPGVATIILTCDNGSMMEILSPVPTKIKPVDAPVPSGGK